MFKLEKLKDKAVLTIYGYVGGYFMDFRVISKALDEITKTGYTKLDFRMHTYGGYVIDGNLIYNFLSSFDGEIDIYIDGVAASMGSIIMMAGTRIHIAENAFIMIHAPQGGVRGTAKDMEQGAKLLRSMEKNFKTKLAERTGMTADEVKEWMDGTDYWFDADESVEKGLADDKFNAKVKDIKSLDKEQVAELGAKAVFEKFSALTINPKNNNSEMDKKDLIARYDLDNVTVDNTDEEVMAALDAKLQPDGDKNVSKLEKEKSDLEAKLKVFEDAEVEAEKQKCIDLVDAAIEDKKITDSEKEAYVSLAEKDFDSTKKILDGMTGAKKPNTGSGSDFNEGAESAWDKRMKEINNK